MVKEDEHVSIKVHVKLFAVLREKAGEAAAELELPAGATVAAAAIALGKRFPAINDLIPKTAFAVNQAYAKSEQTLADGDELAFIPAVSGGAA
jgi:MoaE-MoaD fusion protein